MLVIITRFPAWMQVVRCCLEHAASVAKTFLTADAVVVEIKQPYFRPVITPPMPPTPPMPTPGS